MKQQFLMWDFLLYDVITINEKKNCFEPVPEQNLARRGK